MFKHPDNAPLPDMTKPDSAFQSYPVSSATWQHQYELAGKVYLARRDPMELVRMVLGARRQAELSHGNQPTSVLVDLPCTLFMMDNRKVPVVEEIAGMLHFAPPTVVR